MHGACHEAYPTIARAPVAVCPVRRWVGTARGVDLAQRVPADCATHSRPPTAATPRGEHGVGVVTVVAFCHPLLAKKDLPTNSRHDQFLAARQILRRSDPVSGGVAPAQ